MKSCAAGLSVRSFNITIPTGQGSNGKSTGQRPFALKYSMTAGRIARKRPVAKVVVLGRLVSNGEFPEWSL
jgi:hypothetical protein